MENHIKTLMFFRRENDGGASALHDFLKQGVFQRNQNKI